MSDGRGRKQTPGFKIKRKKRLKKNVRNSKAYKEDKKRRKKNYATGGFRFGESRMTKTEESAKKSATGSRVSTGKGKNETQVANAISKMKNDQKAVTKVTAKGTLGHRPIVIKKKKRR